MKTGTLLGVGLGPGDPALVTIKAAEVIRSSAVVAFFAKEGRRGNARTIADRWIASGCIEVPLYYPMTTEAHFDTEEYRTTLREFYALASQRLSDHLDAGRDVALLAEGDPLFYGSFMHLYVRMRERFATLIIPGVVGMAGCWSAAGEPMTWGDEVMTVIPCTLPEPELVRRLLSTDAAVLMKVGQNFAKVRAAIVKANLLARAIYVERGTMPGEKVVPLSEKLDSEAPYFSIILVPGSGGRRP